MQVHFNLINLWTINRNMFHRNILHHRNKHITRKNLSTVSYPILLFLFISFILFGWLLLHKHRAWAQAIKIDYKMKIVPSWGKAAYQGRTGNKIWSGDLGAKPAYCKIKKCHCLPRPLKAGGPNKNTFFCHLPRDAFWPCS